MTRGIILISTIVLILLLSVGGCRHAGSHLIKEDLPEEADAIVMLQGTVADRVLQCADLLDEGLADRLIMVEENMVSFSELQERGVEVKSQTQRVRGMFLQLGVAKEQITLVPGGAESTMEEALYIREWLRNHPEIGSIVLVSSAYHMRRASKIFSVAFRELDRPVEVYCSPSNYSDANPRTWWRSKEDIQRVLSEYVKIGAFHVIERWRLKE